MMLPKEQASMLSVDKLFSKSVVGKLKEFEK